jgi:hypothetical protein
MWLAATRVRMRAGQGLFAMHGFAGGDHRQRARGRDAQRMHGLADQHLAQHRADGGLAVAVARERRAPRALEGEVAAAAVAVDDFADQQGTAVAELRREVAELVAGIGLGDGCGILGQGLAGEQCGQLVRVGCIEPEPSS